MLSGDHGCDRLPDPFGRRFDFAVADMGERTQAFGGP